jgi:GNAT superfamily N-acetyltransferase
MNFQPYHLTQTDTAVEADRAFLKAQIRQFNNDMSPPHRHVRSHPPRPLDLIVRDDNDQIVAGLSAATYWTCLDIDQLWVREDLRKLGYGRQLLALAEQVARDRACTFAWLSTFSFQARTFYEKYGYYVIGQLNDCPPGATYFWLRKDFNHG